MVPFSVSFSSSFAIALLLLTLLLRHLVEPEEGARAGRRDLENALLLVLVFDLFLGDASLDHDLLQSLCVALRKGDAKATLRHPERGKGRGR